MHLLRTSRFLATFVALATTALIGQTFAQERSAKTNSTTSTTTTAATATTNGQPLIATDPGYRLSYNDEISINIHNEADMSTAQRIDRKGMIRIPYAGDISLANKTVREAEGFLEETFKQKKLLKKPLVSITVREYAPREVTIIGAVGAPGIFNMPREASSMEIDELITRVGGFRPTAKSDQVRVIRIDDTGNETTEVVDVEAKMYGKKNAVKSFLIYPGDKINVPERLF